jgi:6-phosphogluconate dehydrogenase
MTFEEDTRGESDFGMIGLAVMGANLALNIADHGFTVALWNREPEWVERFLKENNASEKFTGAHALEDFVRIVKRPRRIMMMIEAGAPVDEMIERLAPLLDAGDMIIDGGNSWFKDTQRRAQKLEAEEIDFIGAGVSGGEAGARFGPALMPGGRTEAYEQIRPIFEAIAAKTRRGACVTHVGQNGAGHFVKMVHNGIEYADMQLIAEAYDILRRILKMEANELADTFAAWNEGALESFLIEITAQIFTVKDTETDKPLVDLILDRAGQKGTGKWTAQVALDLGVSVPTIAAAIDARVLSSMKAERVTASEKFTNIKTKDFTGERAKLVDAVRDALYASKICAYAQGMNLISKASKEWKWNISLGEMARIWTGGCIIRARILENIMRAYEQEPQLVNLMLDAEFKRIIETTHNAWREVISVAQNAGVPVPAMSASLAYFDSYHTARLPQNLTQAQRDFFGAHTFERADRPEDGFVHFDWAESLKKETLKEVEDDESDSRA